MTIVSEGQVENYRTVNQKEDNVLITDYVSALVTHHIMPWGNFDVDMYRQKGLGREHLKYHFGQKSAKFVPKVPKKGKKWQICEIEIILYIILEYAFSTRCTSWKL